MNLYKITLCIICSTMLITGCKKKENQAPIISITSPSNGQVFNLGATVNINGIATDDNALHEAAIVLTNHMGDTVLADFPTVHSAKSYTVAYNVTVVDSGQHHLQVIFTDHDNAQTEESIIFNVN